MSWESHLIAPRDVGSSWENGLGHVTEALVQKMQRQWPMLQAGLQALRDARRRRIVVGEGTPLTVELFHNPARLTSVVATPSRDAWCPLCAGNLPPEEKGIALGERLVALPNPAPIVRDHVVFAHRSHVPQALAPCLEDLAGLAAMIGDDVVLLYNGPTSGASSPFHLHLQAGRAGDLPLTSQARLPDSGSSPTPWGTLAPMEAGGRRFLLLAVDDAALLPAACRDVLSLLDPGREFPLNLVIWRRGAVHAALFPRGRHRPSCFFLPEDRRLVISPGSVEMAGLVVLPRGDDWETMDADTLEQIYREVCLDDDTWHSILRRLPA